MKKSQYLVLAALVVALFNGSVVEAQPPATAPAPTSTPATPDAPTLNECRQEYGSQICTPTASTTPPRVRRPRPPQWNIVINGSLDGNVRQHGTVETDVGDAEYGIGGNPVCPRGFIDLVIAPSGLRRLREAAGDHNLVRGVYCARQTGDLQSGDEADIDLSLYVTVETFNLLVSRVEDLERRVGEHDNMFITINEDLGDITETVYRDICRDKLSEVSYQQWVDATPAQRIELCPPREIREGGGIAENLDIAFALGGTAMATGIGAVSFEGNLDMRFGLWPSSTARVAPILDLRFGGGRMNDEGGIEIRRPVRLRIAAGLELILAPRVRLDLMVATAAIWSSNTNDADLGDGIRADRGIGGEVGLAVDLTRPRSGAGVVPFIRFDAEVMNLRYNLLNDAAQNGYVRRTSFGAGLSLGIRWGLRDRGVSSAD